MDRNRIRQTLVSLENGLRISLAIAPFIILAGLFSFQWYNSYGQRYSRIDLPDEVTLTDKSNHDSGRGDGCPCYRSWSYVYRINGNIDAKKALEIMASAFRNAGYDTKVDKTDPPKLTFSMYYNQVSVEASPVNLKTKKYDPKHIYVLITERY